MIVKRNWKKTNWKKNVSEVTTFEQHCVLINIKRIIAIDVSYYYEIIPSLSEEIFKRLNKA